MPFTPKEVVETIRMIETERLDIRTVTMGISLRDCADPDMSRMAEKVRRKVTDTARNLLRETGAIEEEYGVPIINKRVSVTPMSILADASPNGDPLLLARALDEGAREVGVNFIGGYSALVEKGITPGDRRLMESIPQVLGVTERVCSSVNVATTKAGINMDAVSIMGRTILETARMTADRDGLGCAKLVVFANAPEDNPFMAGAFHGISGPEAVINVGISGPGVVLRALQALGKDAPLGEVAETVKRMAFKVTRMGELVGREASRRLGVPFGVVDLSLAPTPAPGDSIAEILEAMGLERVGAPGTTAALALLTDAVKKGGAMATSYVGGLSGAFIPVSEDAEMVNSVAIGALGIEKLEAMTAVCSVGLDMIAIPGDTSAETISGIIADEISIGVVNNKTTGVRIIPAPGKKEGDWVSFGGLLGESPVMRVNTYAPDGFIRRGGRIPAPLQALRN